MSANKQPATTGNEPQDEVVRMQESIKALEALRDEQTAEIEKLESEVSDLNGQVDQLGDEVAQLVEDAQVDSEHIRTLAKTRTLLKTGNIDAGRESLERVLDEMDPCWRTFA
jgi:outer membrane murein-binding lipoprotein Lpp